MRQISQNYRTGELSIVDVAPPRAYEGAVLVDTTASLISSGTERMIVDLAKKNLLAKARERPDLVGKVIEKARREGPLAALDAVRSKLDNPIPLGYSLAGRVDSVGRDVLGFSRGERVACAGAGYANHAELNVVPKNLVVRVPDGVTDEEASFVTVGAIALHGVRLAKPQLGDVVVVVGLGLIGQLAVSFLVAHGCDVLGFDTDRTKVERALARGAVGGGVPGVDDCVEVVRAATGGVGADSVVITASSPTNAPLVLAGDVARDRARVSVVGLLPLEVPRKAYYEKELSLVVSRSYGPGRYDAAYEQHGHDYPIGYVRWTQGRNLAAVLQAIARRRIEVRSLITHRFAFGDALDAYELISKSPPEPHLGVILTYPESPAHAPASAPPRAATVGGGTVGVALVGTGSFATSVLLPNLAKLSGARLVATVSGRGLSARHAAERHGASVAGSLDDVLANPEVRMVIIASRHNAHAAQAAKALAAGRDVFVEKPAAINDEQLEVLKTAVQSSSGRLLVGFNRRFAPFARTAKSAFAGRRAGLIMNARINAGRIPPGSWILDPNEGGGRVVGEGCHFIDLLSYWADAHPVRVSAHAIRGGSGYNSEDNLVVTIAFGDGSIGCLTYTAMGDPSVGKEAYEVICEGKVARIDDWRSLAITSAGKTKTSRTLRADKGHGQELADFIDICRTTRPSPIPWDSIEATTRASFAIDRARFEGTTIEL